MDTFWKEIQSNGFQELVNGKALDFYYYPVLARIFLLCPLNDEIRLTSSHDEMKMLFCGENFHVATSTSYNC